MSDTSLADWFGKIPSTDDSRPTEAAFVCSGDGQQACRPPDAMVLPWCVDDVRELIGELHPDCAPLRCRGCAVLASGLCRLEGGMPSGDGASRCMSFVPSIGVTIGRVWLHRLSLNAGRFVWLACIPTITQAEAVRRARTEYGQEVIEVMPIPGALVVPDRLG